MNPTKEFRDYLISQGAALVGIGAVSYPHLWKMVSMCYRTILKLSQPDMAVLP